MNIKGKLKFILSGAFVFLIIYMFLAAFPTGPSMYFQPAWSIDVAAAETAETGDTASRVPFKLGDRFGYFTPQGTLTLSRQTGVRSTVSVAGWAEYPENAESTTVFNPDGTERFTVAARGFAFLDDDRAFLFLPGGDAVSGYDGTGGAVWTREHTAPITAFNSSPKATVIGYADGNLTLLRPDGSEIFSFYPGGSDLEVILGAAVSEDGTKVACVSGIDRQRFLLIKVTGNQYKIVHHEWLEGNLRRQVFTDFDKSGSYAFFESPAGLGIVDTRKLESHVLPVDGRVIAVGSDPGNGPFTALTQDGSECELIAIERPAHLVARTKFSAGDTFLLQRDNALFLGTDGKISRIDIRGIE